MRKLGISEILKIVSEQKTTDEKVRKLQELNTPVLQQILKVALDPTVKWKLPEGQPPYSPSPYDDTQAMLYQEARRMYLFLEGGNDNLTPLRREQLFISFIESIDKEDAKLMLAAKDKKIPYKGINVKLVNTAFPGLISQEK
jgi:hypothetical protein